MTKKTTENTEPVHTWWVGDPDNCEEGYQGPYTSREIATEIARNEGHPVVFSAHQVALDLSEYTSEAILAIAEAVREGDQDPEHDRHDLDRLAPALAKLLSAWSREHDLLRYLLTDITQFGVEPDPVTKLHPPCP